MHKITSITELKKMIEDEYRERYGKEITEVMKDRKEQEKQNAKITTFTFRY